MTALDDARSALDAYGEADFESVSARLTYIATAMQHIHRLTEFNENLGAVLSFLRRAVLLADAAEVQRSALNALVQALDVVSSNPMIELDEAAEIEDKLSHEGWQGDSGIADALVAALLGDGAEEDQALLEQLKPLLQERW